MTISKIKLPNNTVENIADSRILGIDSVPTESSDNVVTSGGVYDSLVDTEEVVSAALNDLNSRIDAATEIPTLYFGDTNNPLTAEQKAHNLEVIQSFVSINEEYNIGLGIRDTEVICLSNGSNTILYDDLRISIKCVYFSNNVYFVIATYTIWFIDSSTYRIIFTTTDGDLSSASFTSDSRDAEVLYFKDRIYDLSLGNENVETSSNDLNRFMPYNIDIRDLHALNYIYEGSLSYDFSFDSNEGYYQLYFDTADKKIRVRVYSDHITTLWTARDITIPVSDVTVGGSSVVNNGVAALPQSVQGNAKVFFGTCSTAAGTAAKVVSCSTFTSSDLQNGTAILVKFDYANSAESEDLTLNVASTGALPILKAFGGQTFQPLSSKAELRGGTHLFVYTTGAVGSDANWAAWVVVGLDYNSNTTYSSMTQAQLDAGTSTTGRLLTPKLLRDNFYTETEVDNLVSTTSITYADLVTLKTNNGLIPGKQYRITDYVTKVTSSYTATRSAEHAFDIIVTATSANTLDEEAKAALHSGDTYFANTNFDAWKIWYCLDNDTTRFDWVDSSCKGAIYRMIDEWDNDVPCDFKNIQYIRWKVTNTSSHPELASLNGLYVGIPNSYSYGLTNDTTDGKWYYTFSLLGSTWSDDVTDASLDGSGAWNNKFGYCADNNDVLYLNHVVYANGLALKSLTNYNDTSYTVVSEFCVCYNKARYITMLGHNAHNLMYGPFRRNIFVGNNRHNTYGTDCQDNTLVFFGDNYGNHYYDFFKNNTIVNLSDQSNAANVFKIYCHDNIIKVNGQFMGNTFGEYFYNNSIISSSSFGQNVFYQNNYNNSFYLTSSTANNIFHYIRNSIFGSSSSPLDSLNVCYIDYVTDSSFLTGPIKSLYIYGQVNNCTFDGNLLGVTINSIVSYTNITTTGSDRFAHIIINGRIRGTSSASIDLDYSGFYTTSVTNTGKRIIIEGTDSGDIIATWQGTQGLEGVKKISGTSTWIPFNTVQGNAKVFFGTCDTAASTGAKVVTCSSFTASDLDNGTILLVQFSSANTASVDTLTLNVNSTGAIPIRKVYNYSTSTLNNAGEIRGVTHQFLCGKTTSSTTYWYLIGSDYNTNTTYSAMTQANIDAGTSTSGLRISPKLLRDNFYTETEVDNLIATPVLYYTSNSTNYPLSSDQIAHNVSVLSELCLDSGFNFNKTKVNLQNVDESAWFTTGYTIEVYTALIGSINNVQNYVLYATMDFQSFGAGKHLYIMITTADGNLYYQGIPADAIVEHPIMVNKAVSSLTLGNENVETTSTNSYFEPYSSNISVGDAGPYRYIYQDCISYGFSWDDTDANSSNHYYQVYFDTADKQIRVRVYSDHITTLWTSRTASTGVTDVTVDGTSVVSNGVAAITIPSRGYIGTTAVQASSAQQNLAGIGTSTFNGVMNITGQQTYAEGIRIHDVSGLSSLWLRATNETGYDAGMIGISGNSSGLRFRLPATSSGTTVADQLTIAYGGAITAANSITASSFIKSGGTSSQFLKADGSVDSNTYVTSVPTISTDVKADKLSNVKTSSPKSVYDEVHPQVESSQPADGMLPNVIYNLGTLSGTVTFTLNTTDVDSNILNHYYWTFETDSTAPTITWPSGISWYSMGAPTINASKHYEISIINNIAIGVEV